MRRLLLILALAGAVAAEGRTPDDILADHAGALGDATGVKTLRATSTVTIAGQPKRGMQTVWRLPGLCKREIPTPKGDFPWREFFGPEGAYVSNWGLLERMRPNADSTRGGFYLFKALAEPFPMLPYLTDNDARRGLKVGSATLEGVRYDVLFTPRDEHGVRAVFLFHPETHLLHNVRYEAQENEPLASVVYSDYARVGGVALPARALGFAVMRVENAAERKFETRKPVREERGIAWEVDPDLGREDFRPPGLPRRPVEGRGFARKTFATGPDPHELALGDLDGDGRVDVAVACEGAVYVHFGGAEESPVRVPLGKGHHRGMAIDDLDLDGRMELITTSNVLPSQTFFVVAFDRERNPTARRLFGAPLLAHTLKTADLDYDGIPDVLATGYGSADLQIKFGNGSGGFRLVGSPWPLRVKRGTRVGLGLDVGDLDGDRMLDIVVSDGQRILFFRGQPNLAFLPHLAVPPKGEEGAGWFPYALAFADLDGDGKDDVVVGRSNRLRDLSGDLQVVRNEPDGAKSKLVLERPLEIGARVEAVGTGHFDGDAHPDIAATSLLTGELVVLFNDGAGGFSKKRMTRWVSGRGAARLAVGDHDGDGRDDVVVSNRLADSISVFASEAGRSGARPPSQRARAVALRPGPTFFLEGLGEPYAFMGEFLLPEDVRDPSGITCLGGVANSQFAFVSDKRAAIYRGVLDRAGKRFLVGPPVPLEGLHGATLDLEGIAFDRASGTLFLAAEQDNSILRATIFGQVLGRAPTKVPGHPRFGIEGIVVRRKLDGTPLVYVFQETGGIVHAYDVADPLVLTPRRTDIKSKLDQTGAAMDGERLLVLSRAAGAITAYEFDEDDGIKANARARFKALTNDALGLELARYRVTNVEGIAVDPRGDLFVLVDHNGEAIGVAGKNRARCGRLLWFAYRGKGERRVQARRVRVKHVHIPWAGAKDAPEGLKLTREQAAQFAREVMRRVRAGEDFDQVGRERHYSRSRFARDFVIVEDNMKVERDAVRRRDVPPAFARLAFSLRVGQAGVCEYHELESPYGYHVLLRVE